jgi:hypothetical protein
VYEVAVLLDGIGREGGGSVLAVSVMCN